MLIGSLNTSGGGIVEVPSNPLVSYIAMRIARHLAAWVEDHDLGFVTGEAGGYMVSGERYAPDIAYLAQEKGPLAPKGYNRIPPDLAVEALSPTDDPNDLRTIKVVNYLRAGTTVWVVNPKKQYVDVYTPNHSPRRIGVDGTLDGAARPVFVSPSSWPPCKTRS